MNAGTLRRATTYFEQRDEKVGKKRLNENIQVG